MARNILAGKLRHRVTVQQFIESQDSYGQENKTWSDHKTIWASVEPLRVRERMEAKQQQTDITHSITIRYLSSITSEDRIKWGSRIFNISEVRNIDEQDRRMQLLAIEVENA